MNLLKWDIYEVDSKESLQGVMFRGRLRKFCLENNINVLTENSQKTHHVRFAIISGENPLNIINFILKIAPGCKTSKVMSEVSNPVLSKLNVNIENRYNILI